MAASNLIDTNVIIRYLVEDPQTIPKKFKGIYSFFQKIEQGETKIELTELVVFESFFVLTRIYKIPLSEATETLSKLIMLKGVKVENRKRMVHCLKTLHKNYIDLVDAYLITLAKEKGQKGIYSFDKDFTKCGLELLEIK